MRLLAVAESDAYVKWAAWMLAAAASSPADRIELCLIDSVVSPSQRQLEIALAGTALAPSSVRRHGLISLRRRIADERPDVVLLALTGPTIAAVTTAIATSDAPRPVLVAGLPGVGLPVRGRALRARRSIDVFVAHSRRERQEYATGFRIVKAPVRVALATLPFLSNAGKESSFSLSKARRVVFAAQPSVPVTGGERRQLLELLAALGPPPPIVKLRQEPSERATHRERDPYGALWHELVSAGRVAPDAVELSTRPLDEVLDLASCLVTISSTVALEAIARGLPVLVASDFGISASLLNEVFAGSGLMAPVTPASIAAAGAPRPEWAIDNYFHPQDQDDWIGVVAEVLQARGSRPVEVSTPLDQVQLRAAGRAAARMAVAGARRTIGR